MFKRKNADESILINNETPPDSQPNDSSTYQHPLYEAPLESFKQKPPEGYTLIFGYQVRQVPFNVFLAVLTVIAWVALVVFIPVYSETAVGVAKSDPYFVTLYPAAWIALVFYCAAALQWLILERKQGVTFRAAMLGTSSMRVTFLVGALTTWNGVCVLFASLPSRTPANLQAILATLNIPFTVIARRLIIRKGVSFRRLACTGAVLVGVFIALEPQIWNINGSGGDSSQSTGKTTSTFERIIWPIVFSLGFIPVGIINTYFEKETKAAENSGSLIFLAWVQLFNFITIAMVFWLDFIPGFGMASSPADFGAKMLNGLACHVGARSSCLSLVPLCAAFVIFYCAANLMSILLIKYAEGAVYAVIVLAMTTPLATLFWMLFTPKPTFRWHPNFTLSTGFVLAGLAIIIPSVILYNLFSLEDSRREKESKTKIDTLKDSNINDNTTDIIVR